MQAEQHHVMGHPWRLLSCGDGATGNKASEQPVGNSQFIVTMHLDCPKLEVLKMDSQKLWTIDCLIFKEVKLHTVCQLKKKNPKTITPSCLSFGTIKSTDTININQKN